MGWMGIVGIILIVVGYAFRRELGMTSENIRKEDELKVRERNLQLKEKELEIQRREDEIRNRIGR